MWRTGLPYHYRSDKVIALEGDVVVTRKAFYRVTAVPPPAGGTDLPSHLRALTPPVLSTGMINLFSRAGYPLWMNLIVSRFPGVFLDPNPHVFDNPTAEIAAIDPKDRVNLRYGFKCREGWAGLIDEIAGTGTALVKVLRESGAQPDAWIHSKIVKAKMGLLVFSGDTHLKEPFRTIFSGYVTSICARSSSVCEVTGKYGKLREINGWRETLCDEECARRTKSRGPTKE